MGIPLGIGIAPRHCARSVATIAFAAGLVFIAGCPWGGPGRWSSVEPAHFEQPLPGGGAEVAQPLALPPNENAEVAHAANHAPVAPAQGDVSESHSPSEGRVLGALYNTPAPLADIAELADALEAADFRVRAQAIAALGRLPGAQGRARLLAMLDDSSEATRAAALAALAGEREVQDRVLGMAGDKAWRVRLVVAESLRQYPDRHGAAVAARLLDDPSPTVQAKVIASLGEWPFVLAGPVLLEAMGKPVLATRTAAAQQLAAWWAPAAEFRSLDPEPKRAEMLGRLQQQFRRQFGVRPGGPDATVDALGAVTPEVIDRVDRLVRQSLAPDSADSTRQHAIGELKMLGPIAVEALQRLTLDRQQSLPDAVYRQVLPAVAPAFAELDRLMSSDADQRRRAAAALTALTAEKPLPLLALDRLASLAARETDALVWEELLTAVASDPREPAVRMAYLAIGHSTPEVRRRACQYLAAHPDPQHAAVLIPALRDPIESVAQAAVQAIGLAGRVADPQPIKPLLGAANESLRLDAAVALARLGDPSGPAALERLAYSTDPTIRRQVAVAMGELADPTSTATLVRLLDDHQGVRRAALEALPKVVGHDPAAAAGVPPSDLARRIELWKRWFTGEQTAQRVHHAPAADRNPRR